MESLTLYNTLSRRREAFAPSDGKTARMYTCGPTVHDYAHIGNFRAYVFEDLLRRQIEACGHRVCHVMNLTDVDDKTIRKSRDAGVPLGDFTRRFAEAFFEDLQTLRILRAHRYPAATEHVPEMLALIQRLLDGGFAYRAEDGSVYFSIERFPNYGRLARLDREGLRPGARVAQDEYEKESVGDFALWKAWDPEDGDVAWDAPWGRGRPGWHIECSAMSMKYLGESFDIHTGGMDNIFPHHEDEIAQSEAATGKPLARFWLHCAHLVVDGRKMSKSLGNFHRLRDLTERGYSGREVRYVLLATHYRKALNFTLASLDAARSALQRVDTFLRRLRSAAEEAPAEPIPPLPAWAGSAPDRFSAAMNDDLNVSEALAAAFDLVHEGNRVLDRGGMAPAEAVALLALWEAWDRVLAVLTPGEDPADDKPMQRVRQREEARRQRDWAEADRIRDELAEMGWIVQDTPDGPELRRR